MRRTWVILLAVGLVGLLAGVAITGRPAAAPNDVVIVVVPVTTSTTLPTTLPATTLPATTVPTTSAPASTTTAPSTTTRPTTTTIAENDRATVRVVAANAAGVNGAAARTVTRLRELGYELAIPSDALTNVAVTVVYAREGFEAQAELVAADLELPPESIQPLTTAITSDDSQGDVIVAVGRDLLT